MQIIAQVGFPIAVAAYLLVEFRRTIEDNTAVMQRVLALLEAREERPL